MPRPKKKDKLIQKSICLSEIDWALIEKLGKAGDDSNTSATIRKMIINSMFADCFKLIETMPIYNKYFNFANDYKIFENIESVQNPSGELKDIHDEMIKRFSEIGSFITNKTGIIQDKINEINNKDDIQHFLDWHNERYGDLDSEANECEIKVDVL